MFHLRVAVVCCARARRDGGRHERRGRLSQAKTQRRPHSARERVRGGVSFVVFVVFVSFFQQGKEKIPRGDDYEKRR